MKIAYSDANKESKDKKTAKTATLGDHGFFAFVRASSNSCRRHAKEG